MSSIMQLLVSLLQSLCMNRIQLLVNLLVIFSLGSVDILSVPDPTIILCMRGEKVDESVTIILLGFNYIWITYKYAQLILINYLRPIYTEQKHLCFSVYFDVEGICIHH